MRRLGMDVGTRGARIGDAISSSVAPLVRAEQSRAVRSRPLCGPNSHAGVSEFGILYGVLDSKYGRDVCANSSLPCKSDRNQQTRESGFK